MPGHSLLSPPHVRRPFAAIAGAAVLALALLGGGALLAQVMGERGIAPIASTTDIDVGGIDVNVVGKTPEDARQQGWKLAQKLAWKKLGGPDMPDDKIDAMVSAVVIENERVGPQRYVATLGVVFDRKRAGALLGRGAGDTGQPHSAPMLTLPVLVEGGTQTMYEVQNPWQRAWAQFQPGASSIDYVRPVGSNGDSLLLTYGQVGRRSRAWWSNILDSFSAADILVPIARLQRQWPGGPVRGTFTARFGPDNTYLDQFTMTANNDNDVPQMLEAAVKRFDAIFSQALADGKLRPDPTLNSESIRVKPEFQPFLDAGRRADEAATIPLDLPPPAANTATLPGGPAAAPAQAVNGFTVQFATPSAASVDASIGAVREAPGVRAAASSSIAIGGTSVMRVSFAGDLDQLAAALRSRGFQVSQSGDALVIRR